MQEYLHNALKDAATLQKCGVNIKTEWVLNIQVFCHVSSSHCSEGV
jgi:hypothetical protein